MIVATQILKSDGLGLKALAHASSGWRLFKVDCSGIVTIAHAKGFDQRCI
jgi:hypothetical protein